MKNYLEGKIPKKRDEGISDCEGIILQGCENTRNLINNPNKNPYRIRLSYWGIDVNFFELYENGCLLEAEQHPDITSPGTLWVKTYSVYLEDKDEIYYLRAGQNSEGKMDENTEKILKLLGKKINIDCYEEYKKLLVQIENISKLNIFKLKKIKTKLLELKKEIDKLDEKKLDLISKIEDKIKKDTKKL